MPAATPPREGWDRIEPPPSRWEFTPPPAADLELDLELDRERELGGADADAAEGDDLVAVGADLRPGTVLAAYRAGLFPMGVGPDGSAPIGWWSPDPRGVLDPHRLRVSRSLRRARRAAEVTLDADFSGVVRGCADPARDGRWITDDVHDAYLELHRLGWAHSIEVWRPGGRGPDDLLGGLYGLSVGGLFAGESMFHRATDASKVALVGLCEILTAPEPHAPRCGSTVDDDGGSVDAREPGHAPWSAGAADEGAGVDAHATPISDPSGLPGAPRRLVDVQWLTPHLASLGAVEIRRADYLAALPALTSQRPPLGFRSRAAGHTLRELREPGATPPR